MDKYEIFKAMMEFVADRATVTDADMNAWDGMMIFGENGDEIITIKVSIEKKEVQGNAEELE